MKKVNGQTVLNAQIGDTVTFTIVIDNDSDSDADNVVFTDLLETDLLYVPGSFKINNVGAPDPNLSAGVSLGTIAMMTTMTLEFKAMIIGLPHPAICLQIMERHHLIFLRAAQHNLSLV